MLMVPTWYKEIQFLSQTSPCYAEGKEKKIPVHGERFEAPRFIAADFCPQSLYSPFMSITE